MPALSCPRCCSAYSPRYTRFAASGWFRMPKTPHSSLNLSNITERCETDFSAQDIPCRTMASLRRLLAVTSVLLLAALAAGADELVITRGGRRVIDPDPNTATTNCNGWSFDPAPVAFENDISKVYSTSGILQNHCNDQFPFGDQIWSGRRGSNGVFTVQPAITRTTFRWMFGDLPIDPLTYIGRVASPSVIKTFDGRYLM